MKVQPWGAAILGFLGVEPPYTCRGRFSAALLEYDIDVALLRFLWLRRTLLLGEFSTSCIELEPKNALTLIIG